MVDKFIEELERAVEALVKSRLREVVMSLQGGESLPGGGRAKGTTVAELRAIFGLPPSIVATAPAVVSAGRVATETVRARPGRCVGVITGGRRCGRAAPPGDPPLCSFCRATAALVNGATARVQITLSPPDPNATRPERIQISSPGPTIDPALVASARKERCKGVLLGGGSCRSRVMPPNELCPWCRALGVRPEGEEAAQVSVTSPPAATTRPV